MPCSHCKQKGHNIRTFKYTDCTYTVLKNLYVRNLFHQIYVNYYDDKF